MSKLFGLILALISVNLTAFSKPVLLFDGTLLDMNTAVIQPDVKQILERGAFPKAKKYFKTSDNCQATEVNTLDGARIAVSPGQSEKVYLYSFFCGDARHRQGFSVIKNGEVTENYEFNVTDSDLLFTNIFYRGGQIVLVGDGGEPEKSNLIVVFAIDLGLLRQTTSALRVSKTMSLEEMPLSETFIAYESAKESAQKIYIEYGSDGAYYLTEGFQKKADIWVKTRDLEISQDGVNKLEKFTVLK